MTRRSTLFELDLARPRPGARDAADVLYRQLRDGIADGRLAAGSRLPAGRQSRDVYGVSRNTAGEVYGRLLAEGYVVARRGAGTFVAERPAPTAPRVDGTTTAGRDPRLNAFWSGPAVTAAIGYWQHAASRDAVAAVADFRPAIVDARHFPHAVFRRMSAQALRAMERSPAALRSPQGNRGHRALRDAVTRHIAVTRAVACGPDDVLVTAGAQQALDVIARALVTAGVTTVAVEDPGYPPLRVAFAAAGARIVPVPVDAEGLVVDALPADARIVCVTPSHQFPLGVSMSPARRRQLVAFARAHGAVIVEDDYDGEFRYEGSPLAALCTGDAADVVFYVGTFSKCMLPSLRLGFVVAPRWAIDTLTAVKNGLDWHCPVPLQATVAAFLAGGHLTHHVRAMRERYRARRRLLLDALRDDFAGLLAPLPSCYGMHVAAFAADGVDVAAAATLLAGDGVQLHTLERYFAGPSPRAGLVLGYGAVDPSRMRRGLDALKATLR